MTDNSDNQRYVAEPLDNGADRRALTDDSIPSIGCGSESGVLVVETIGL